MRWSLVWLLGSVSTVHAQSGAEAIRSATPVIAKADSEWLDATRAHDVARIVAPYDSAAVFVMATGAVLRGRDAIADLYRSRFTKIVQVTDGGIVRDDMRAINDTLIYEWGHGAAVSSGGLRTRYHLRAGERSVARLHARREDRVLHARER